MADTSRSEYEPLLANSEARERAKRTASKKRFLLISGLALVVVVLVIAITVPLVTSNKATQNDNLEVINGSGDVQFFSIDWNNDGSQCVRPPVPFKYNSSQLSGLWYEIAKVQTPATAVFQEGCSCTTMTIEFPTAYVPQTLMRTECRDARLSGTECGAISTMEEQSRRGHWIQTLYGEDMNWYVILQNHELLLTYDCTISYDGEVQYGIHLYSRGQRLNAETVSSKVDNIIQFYGSFLNPQKIVPVFVEQSHCTYPLIRGDEKENYDYYKDLIHGVLDLEMDFLYE